MVTVFIDGQEGTTGLQLHERLAQRADLVVLPIDPALRKEQTVRQELLNRADIAFLCLPEVAAREAVTLVNNPQTCVIDASPAFRTASDWVYGLPELTPTQRQQIRASKQIAVPGCHATAFTLLVHPLVATGLMPPDYPVTCYSLTGYSGGGKRLIQSYEQAFDPKLQSPRPSALHLHHKHLPEMQLHTGLCFAPLFVPVVGNYYKGLTVTVFLTPRLLTRPCQPSDLYELYAAYYRHEPFIRVMPIGGEENLDRRGFDVQGCNDTNRTDLFIFGDAQQIALLARLDNLGKGSSGAAIQCMNIHLGLDEMTGLHLF